MDQVPPLPGAQELLDDLTDRRIHGPSLPVDGRAARLPFTTVTPTSPFSTELLIRKTSSRRRWSSVTRRRPSPTTTVSTGSIRLEGV
jgi:hypothetical protein